VQAVPRSPVPCLLSSVLFRLPPSPLETAFTGTTGLDGTLHTAVTIRLFNVTGESF
jgi:hypothetical protein